MSLSSKPGWTILTDKSDLGRTAKPSRKNVVSWECEECGEWNVSKSCDCGNTTHFIRREH